MTETVPVPKQIRLQLPEPPNFSQNQHKSWSYEWTRKKEYMERCWRAAYYQQLPYAPRVIRQVRWRVSGHFRLHTKRDPVENLPYALKFVLDCLKANHRRDASLEWRKNGEGKWMGKEKGYIFDDDERWVTRGLIDQEICRTEPEDEFSVSHRTRGLEFVLTVDKVYPANEFVERGLQAV